MLRHALLATAAAAAAAITPTAAHADRFQDQLNVQMLSRLAVAARTPSA